MRCRFGLVVVLGLVACGDKPDEDDGASGGDTGVGESEGGAQAVADAVCALPAPIRVPMDLTAVQPFGVGFIGVARTESGGSVVRLGPTGTVEAERVLDGEVFHGAGAVAVSTDGDRALVARATRDERTGDRRTHIDIDVLDEALQPIASASLEDMHRNAQPYVRLQSGGTAEGWWVVWSMQRIYTTDGLDGAVFSLDADLSIVQDARLDVGVAASAGPGGPFLQTVHPDYIPEDAPDVDEYAVRARATDGEGVPAGEWTDLGAGHAHSTGLVPAGAGGIAITATGDQPGDGDVVLWTLGADGAATTTESLGDAMMGTSPLASLAGGALLSWWDFNGADPVPRLEAIGADGARADLTDFPVGAEGQVLIEAPSVATSDDAIVLWWAGDSDETWLSRCER